VLDTLSRVLAGGDENSPQDMGLFIRNAAELRHESQAHIAIIHHGTKASNGSNPRGHSSLTGADDALIEVTRNDDGSRAARVVHAKDDADGIRWGFALDAVELGVDDDGDPVTTLIVREDAEPQKAAPKETLSADQQVALACFDRAMKAEAQLATVGEDNAERPVITAAAWRRWYYAEAKPGASQDAKSQAFKRALTGLMAKKRIDAQNDFVWRPEIWG
jgi:hypothetical protein